MPKEFYTERDIEDMWKRGIFSLTVTDDVALTELAYEKAGRLGMKLVRDQPLEPPAAPIRPYLSQPVKPVVAPGPPAAPATSPAADADLTARIREAVSARLGTQVDPALLDVIIQRVLKSTGVK